MYLAASDADEKLGELLRQYNNIEGGTEEYASKDRIAYTLSQLPMGARRPLKVVCAGAGFSGLAFAREVETGRLQNLSLTVFEKNASIGGTWYENRYPGCACGKYLMLAVLVRFNRVIIIIMADGEVQIFPFTTTSIHGPPTRTSPPTMLHREIFMTILRRWPISTG